MVLNACLLLLQVVIYRGELKGTTVSFTAANDVSLPLLDNLYVSNMTWEYYQEPNNASLHILHTNIMSIIYFCCYFSTMQLCVFLAGDLCLQIFFCLLSTGKLCYPLLRKICYNVVSIALPWLNQ